MSPHVRKSSTTLAPLAYVALVACAAVVAGCPGAPDEPASASDPVEEPAETPGPSLEEIQSGWAGTICADYIACYAQHDVNGAIDGRLVADIGADGSVTGVTYSGSAPPPVRGCLVELIRPRGIDGYTASGGVVECQYSGTYNNGMQMLSEGWMYTDAPAEPGAGEAEPGAGEAEPGAGSGQ